MTGVEAIKPTGPTVPAGPTPEPMAPGLAGLLHGLMARAEPNMTDAELRHVADDDTAQHLAHLLATVAEGVGCLVVSDAESKNSGALQSPGDVAAVLFLIANVASAIDGLLSIGTRADLALMGREMNRRAFEGHQ